MNIEKLNLKPVKDFDGYYVSECGKIVSKKQKSPRIMTTWLGSSGYEMLKLSKDGELYWRQVHRLVGEAFVPNPNNLPEIHHKDNNPVNNHYSNLEWITRKDNLRHSYKTMSPTRNFKKCELHHIEKGYVKSFNNKKEACDYAGETFGCSKTSLMKYLITGEYKLVLNV